MEHFKLDLLPLSSLVILLQWEKFESLENRCALKNRTLSKKKHAYNNFVNLDDWIF